MSILVHRHRVILIALVRYAASIIMAVTYGYNALPKDDPLVAPIEEMIKIVIVTPERAVFRNLFPQRRL